MLLTRPRRWPWLLLAVLPVHLIVEHGTGWPLALVLSLFVTNCLEALIAAGGMLMFSDAPRKFDTFPRLTAFLVAAVGAAPLLSSFADAAAVTLFRGEPYWTVFKTRILSNALSELTFVPAVVGVAGAIATWRSGLWTRRAPEAAVLIVGFTAVWATGLHSELAQSPALRAVTSQMPLALQLPFLLWTAVRFGPVGTAVALLATSLLSAWALVHGVGPLIPIDPTTTITALIISLLVVSITMLCLSTLLEERRSTQQALASRLGFEELLSRLSGAFVHLPSDQMDSALEKWLDQIGATLDVDALALFVGEDQLGNFRATYWWSRVPFSPPEDFVVARDFPWAVSLMLERRVLDFPNEDAFPPDAAATDRATLRALGFKAGLALPLAGNQAFLGVLACASNTERQWPDELRSRLRLISEVMTNVLLRKQTEDALRRSELMKSAILQSLATGVAVVDRLGTIVALNESWSRLARESGVVPLSVGGNLLLGCEARARQGDSLAAQLAPGISAVLYGQQPRFALDHRSEATGDPRWWTIQVLPLGAPEGGAVIAQSDVTDLRRAELEAQRSRQELAHMARVSTVGELTASIAHQLNQPLGAIMTNAQAARRVLDSPNPDFLKLHAILVDIVKDDRRASDIIKRLRDLLRRGETATSRVDLTKVIRDVADLVVGDAIVRGITVALDVDAPPAFVRGDSIQLQQMVLNLLQNAMDAVSDEPPGSRVVTVRCRARGDDVCLGLYDTGPGLPAGAEDQLFEPFYTTKPHGMGMGLPIVRSIVEAHGGRVNVGVHVERGAAFEVVLPRDAEMAS